MANNKPTSIRFSAEDKALIDQLQRKLASAGLPYSQTEVLHRAVLAFSRNKMFKDAK